MRISVRFLFVFLAVFIAEFDSKKLTLGTKSLGTSE